MRPREDLLTISNKALTGQANLPGYTAQSVNMPGVTTQFGPQGVNTAGQANLNRAGQRVWGLGAQAQQQAQPFQSQYNAQGQQLLGNAMGAANTPFQSQYDARGNQLLADTFGRARTDPFAYSGNLGTLQNTVAQNATNIPGLGTSYVPLRQDLITAARTGLQQGGGLSDAQLRQSAQTPLSLLDETVRQQLKQLEDRAIEQGQGGSGLFQQFAAEEVLQPAQRSAERILSDLLTHNNQQRVEQGMQQQQVASDILGKAFGTEAGATELGLEGLRTKADVAGSLAGQELSAEQAQANRLTQAMQALDAQRQQELNTETIQQQRLAQAAQMLGLERGQEFATGAENRANLDQLASAIGLEAGIGGQMAGLGFQQQESNRADAATQMGLDQLKNQLALQGGEAGRAEAALSSNIGNQNLQALMQLLGGEREQFMNELGLQTGADLSRENMAMQFALGGTLADALGQTGTNINIGQYGQYQGPGTVDYTQGGENRQTVNREQELADLLATQAADPARQGYTPQNVMGGLDVTSAGPEELFSAYQAGQLDINALPPEAYDKLISYIAYRGGATGG